MSSVPLIIGTFTIEVRDFDARNLGEIPGVIWGAFSTANICPCVLCDCHIHRGRVRALEAAKRSAEKHTGECITVGSVSGSEVLIAVIAWSRNPGVGLVVAAVTPLGTTTHELLPQTLSLSLSLSLFPPLFFHERTRDLSPTKVAIYLSTGVFFSRTYVAHPFFRKITALSAPALVRHHLLSTAFTIKWPRNCDCFTWAVCSLVRPTWTRHPTENGLSLSLFLRGRKMRHRRILACSRFIHLINYFTSLFTTQQRTKRERERLGFFSSSPDILHTTSTYIFWIRRKRLRQRNFCALSTTLWFWIFFVRHRNPLKNKN